ncbi:glycoside hydrolase family 16 protein [Arcticibacter eurypsychrophilus]|uniref:glycoside hydrolase family 16 protein n=1 Tax=Arcticibacter eurypsychrophilus TaxID=1434752 RepID=UPI00084E0804|nr:glycoside hydrolase family 16 protein [Arcticibacter eurypsychrophilus]
MIQGRNVALIILFTLFLFQVKAQDPIKNSNNESSIKGYKLMWADEFNKDGAPNPKNWKFEQGFQRNNELQWYQFQNAWCERGVLVIEARKESKPNPTYSATSTNWNTKRPNIEYTSSSLNTNGLHAWRYGKFIIRGKIHIGPGLWPAIWTLGKKGEWPSNGEIDIMEYYKGDILANVATGTTTRFKAKWFSTKKPVTDFNDLNWADKFHIWRMDWDEVAISLYVDDKLLNRVELKDLVIGNGTNPFNDPHYMLLNLAIGGDNGGDPSITKFPKRFEVDYVRVYQK